MASNEMSLEDIIRKKGIRTDRTGFRGGPNKLGFKQNNQLGKGFKTNRGGFNGNQRNIGIIGDARNKIILKKRTKIADARDKLAEIAKQRDARVKLNKLKMKKGFIGAQLMSQKGKIKLQRGFADLTRQVHPSPLLPPNRINTEMAAYAMDVDMEDEYVPPPMKIVRCVNNDLVRYVPPPPRERGPPSPPPRKRGPHTDKRVLPSRSREGYNLTVVTRNHDIRRQREGESSRRQQRISPPRSPQPVSILKKRPSMSAAPSPTSPPSSSASYQHTSTSSGYRILVSNLQSSVTASDIHELFGDIGHLLDSRLVRPGTAEVIYSRLEDAQKAVEVYHNRQLDGQPMNCFLVNPRTSTHTSSKASSSYKSRLGATLPASSNSSVVPDVSTFYKVLFGKD